MSTGIDDRILQRARAGDRHAFDQIVAQYEKVAYNVAYRMTGHHEDAADIGQEAFIRVYQRLGEFRGDSSFETWLRRIVTNACLDELRKRKRQRLVSLDEPMAVDDGELGRQFADTGEGPHEAAERNETQRLVQEAITRLDEDYRIVLVLRDIEDLSYEEIASSLRLPLGTVKSRLNRARAALKDILGAMELFSARFVYRGKRARGRLSGEVR